MLRLILFLSVALLPDFERARRRISSHGRLQEITSHFVTPSAQPVIPPWMGYCHAARSAASRDIMFLLIAPSLPRHSAVIRSEGATRLTPLLSFSSRGFSWLLFCHDYQHGVLTLGAFSSSLTFIAMRRSGRPAAADAFLVAVPFRRRSSPPHDA